LSSSFIIACLLFLSLLVFFFYCCLSSFFTVACLLLLSLLVISSHKLVVTFSHRLYTQQHNHQMHLNFNLNWNESVMKTRFSHETYTMWSTCRINMLSDVSQSISHEYKILMRSIHNMKYTQNEHVRWCVLISTWVKMSWTQTAALIIILQTLMNKTDVLRRKWAEWRKEINSCCSAYNIRVNY